MSVWQYTAVALEPQAEACAKRGEITSESAQEARATLRRLGLQVVEMHPLRGGAPSASGAFDDWRHAYLRKRRRDLSAEFYDSLATLLDSGAPIVEAVDTVLHSQQSERQRNMLLLLHEALRSGHSLSSHMEGHPGWFGPDEVAMVRAGEHSGELSRVLRRLSEHNERASELGNKVVGALTYPSVVLAVGIAALIFLSTQTLPDLVKILSDAQVETPVLTTHVMAIGQNLATWGPWILLALPCLIMAVWFWRASLIRRGVEPPRFIQRLCPEFLRRMTLAGVTDRLSELTRSGVPMVESLRVLAPTVRNPVLSKRLRSAADEVERGAELSSALSDELWFNAEFRHLLDIGVASGELDTLLARISARYERRARRLVDRLVAFLEPAVILALAAAIGVVVLAAILPMVRLQEILG